MDSNPLHGCPGGLYRPTPRGTMVIRPDAGPAVSLSGRRLIRRLLGPADWWAPLTGSVQSRQAASAAGGSCRLQITVAVLLMTRARSWGHGNSSAVWRAITVATPCRVWLMAHGARGRGWPTPGGRLVALSPSSVRPPTSGTRRPWVVPADRRGHRTPPTGVDVRADMATVLRRAEISAGTAYCGHACPWKRTGMDLTVATPRPVPLYEGMGVVGVAGRLPMAGFSGSRQLGVGSS